LFSNEGDEVLRQISTLANFFTFPTLSREHGYRLAMWKFCRKKMGIVEVADANFLKVLRIGDLTLQELYDRFQAAARRRHAAAVSAIPWQKAPI